MPNLQARVKLNFTATQVGDNDFGGPVLTPNVEKILDFANGTAANQADILFMDRRSISAASNDDLDLAGVLQSFVGTTITTVEVCGIIIAADSANAGVLNVGGGTNPWITMWLATGDGIKVGPGGVFMNVAPDANGLGAVTAGTGDILRVNNPSGSVATYEIIILGRTA